MERFDVWKDEMAGCCTMLLRDLHGQLLARRLHGMTSEINICTRYPAAPRNEMLFEIVSMQILSDADGRVEVYGIVWYPDLGKGERRQRTLIRKFDDADSCLDWLDTGYPAAKECAEELENDVQ